MQHGLVNAQCSDPDEALLKVSYPYPSWQDGDNNKVEIYITGSSPQAGSSMIEEINLEYPSNTTISFEKCLPKENTCGHIAVSGPPMNMYEILWDGQVVVGDIELYDNRKGGLNTFLSTRQFGVACVLTCENSEEAVFEFRFTKVAYSSNKERVTQYLVEDQNGNKVIAHDEQPWNALSEEFTLAGLYVKKMCLPMNDCYRFIMGEGEANYYPLYSSVSFDGKNIFSKEAPLFISSEFGDACPGTKSCDPDEESTVEFFLNSQYGKVPLSWELKSYDESNSSGPKIIHSEIQPSNLNISLHHDMVCVPKQSCLAFSLITPEHNSTNTWGSARYMLKMDETIYRHERFLSQYPDTIYLGDCTDFRNTICDTTQNSLLELNFQAISPTHWYDFYYEPYPRILWRVDTLPYSYFDDDTIENLPYYDSLPRSDFVDEHEFGQSYRMIQCIPSEKCMFGLYVFTGLSFDEDITGFETYSIKVNGILATSDVKMNSNTELTVLDNDCKFKSDLSGGAIAGIAVASVVVGGALIAFILVVIKRKKWDVISA